MRTIAIDFDNCASSFPTKVNGLYDNQENLIIIYTARPEYLRQQTMEELRIQGIHYHALVMNKLRADIYIDDKNCGGLKWPEF